MKKHILHFLMILLVVGMLAGCDTPATAAPQPTNTPSAVTVETAAPTETPAEVSSEAAPLWSISLRPV